MIGDRRFFERMLVLVTTFLMILSPMVAMVLSMDFDDSTAGAEQGMAKTVYVAKYGDDGTGHGSRGKPYLTIQKGIDEANEDDTIWVFAGTYEENVLVDKRIDLVGNGTTTTFINGGGSGDVVEVAAEWVNLSGFAITGSGSRG